MPMNKTLLAGLLITTLMIAASFVGKYFASHELDDRLTITYVTDENGKGTLLVPPSPPNANYPFGTDKNGYDIMAKLLAGSQYTIFVSLAVAFARILIGGISGLLLGYFGQEKKSWADRLPIWNLLNGIPIFIIVWMVMIGITINPGPSPFVMSFILGVVLTCVGIPSVAFTIKEKTRVIREKQFVLSAKALGASQWKIVRTHVFPHVKESFVILFVQEIILILGLLGSLGIFNIFVGGTQMNVDPTEFVSRTNEWSGLIAQARTHLYVYQWILLIPLAAYVVFIIGFHLISVGLEKMYRNKYAKYSHI